MTWPNDGAGNGNIGLTGCTELRDYVSVELRAFLARGRRAFGKIPTAFNNHD